MLTFPTVCLASGSPRRAELLQQLNVPFEQHAVNVDETIHTHETALVAVQRLALMKAQAGWQATANKARLPALGSDTMVVVDEAILGKPLHAQDHTQMLKKLSGRCHTVLTAVALYAHLHDSQQPWQGIRVSRTEVCFSQWPEHAIYAYWQTGEPADKAGGYAVQGLAAEYIERIQGSYSGVVGLPLFETAALLRLYQGEL